MNKLDPKKIIKRANKFGTIILQYNEWDSRPFKQDVWEIVGFHAEQGYSPQLANFLSEELNSINCDIAVIRLDARDATSINALQVTGNFSFTEYSLQLVGRTHELKPNDVFADKVTLQYNVANFLDQIVEIGTTAFDYGRYSEDILISKQQNFDRQKTWIHDMISQEQKLFLQVSDSTLVSFMFYNETDGIANLLLGGSRRGQGLASVYFWHAIVKDLKSSSIIIRTTVSAANTNVLRLYTSLGFHVEKPLVGLRWKKIWPATDEF